MEHAQLDCIDVPTAQIFAWKETQLVVWKARVEGTSLAWRVVAVLSTSAEIGFVTHEQGDQSHAHAEQLLSR